MKPESTELAWARGYRAGLLKTLGDILHALGYGDRERTYEERHAAQILEREVAIAQLRDLCQEFGDNEWDDHLHLGDIIEKHLARHLHGR